MKLAAIALHQTSLVRTDNPLGATALFREGGYAAVVKAATKLLEAPGIDGIMLQRFHGSLAASVIVGVTKTGKPIDTFVASPEDRPVPAEELKAWAELARRAPLAIYTTMPRTEAGWAELARLAEIEPWGVVYDVAGQNTSIIARRAVAAADDWCWPEGPGGIPEPTPLPHLRPEWQLEGDYTAALADRWRTLERAKAMPTTGLVIYNGNKRGKSLWRPSEAARWEKRGLDIAGPAIKLAPQAAVDARIEEGD